ncbi:DUF1874 domain-containing protein [Nonomuraea sp. NPDC049141]|uniref:STIV orfB116 family protein n=1 Tax=Nonomuraea sp. NPDC049141 TaxID=3155500 RepID=UPI0033DB867D
MAKALNRTDRLHRFGGWARVRRWTAHHAAWRGGPDQPATVRQQPGQRARVCKLNGRPPEGQVLSLEDLEEIGYSFKLLERLS